MCFGACFPQPINRIPCLLMTVSQFTNKVAPSMLGEVRGDDGSKTTKMVGRKHGDLIGHLVDWSSAGALQCKYRRAALIVCVLRTPRVKAYSRGLADEFPPGQRHIALFEFLRQLAHLAGANHEAARRHVLCDDRSTCHE